MKRVLHLIDTTGPGGAETVFLSLIRGLPRDEWESIPIVQGSGWVQDSLRAGGYDPPVVPSQRPLDIGYVRDLRRTIRDKNIDLVHGHLLSSALYGGLAARLAGVPMVATLHGIPDLQGSRLKYEIIRRLVNRIVFVSQSLRDHAISNTPLKAGNSSVIHNGIDLRDFHPRGREQQHMGDPGAPLLIGAVGNIRALKDYPTFLQAAALVEAAAPGRCRFVIAGETNAPLFSELMELRQTLGLEKNLEFLGFRADIASFLRTLDIFVLSSSSEGFSIATIQAMATGVPVVATRSGGPEEIIQHGETGFLVSTESPRELAEGILSLVCDPGLMSQLGRDGRRQVESNFSLDAMIRGYDRLYREILSV